MSALFLLIDKRVSVLISILVVLFVFMKKVLYLVLSIEHLKLQLLISDMSFCK